MTIPTGSRVRRRIHARALQGAALLGLAALTGCATMPMSPPPADPYAPYKVGAPDVLSVSILPEPVIQQDVTVRPDGMITIELVGDVPAGGRTADEIAADVQERIARYKRDAVVTVAVSAALSSAITVLGEVRAPAAFPLTKVTRITEALGQVGGTTSFANADEIRVVRYRGGKPLVLMVDLDAIRAGDMTTNIQVHGGDIVYVPPTIWARFGYTVQAALFPFQPFIGIGTAAATAAIVR